MLFFRVMFFHQKIVFHKRPFFQFPQTRNLDILGVYKWYIKKKIKISATETFQFNSSSHFYIGRGKNIFKGSGVAKG